MGVQPLPCAEGQREQPASHDSSVPNFAAFRRTEHAPHSLFSPRFIKTTQKMATAADIADLQAKLEAAQAAQTQQGDAVRALKAAVKEGKADKVRCSLRAPIDGFWDWSGGAALDAPLRCADLPSRSARV